MSYQKLGKSIFIYGFCTLIVACLKLGINIYNILIFLSDNISRIPQWLLDSDYIAMFLQIGGIIIMLVGFNQSSVKTDKQIKKIRNCMIGLMIAFILDILWRYSSFILMTKYQLSTLYWSFLMKITALIFWIPMIFLSTLFYNWGINQINQQRFEKKKGFAIILGSTLVYTLSSLFDILLVFLYINKIYVSIIVYFFFPLLIAIANVLLCIGWISSAFQIQKINSLHQHFLPIPSDNKSL